MADTREKVVFTIEVTKIVKEISTFEVEAKTEEEAWTLYYNTPRPSDEVIYRLLSEELVHEDSKIFYIPLGEGDE